MAWLMRRGDRGSTWYICFWTADGRQVRRAAGKSRRPAERIRAKIETQLREGKFFEEERKSAWTLGQLSEVYLERLARMRPESARWRNEMYRQLLRVLGSNFLIEEISIGTLDRYVNRRRGEGRQPSTINREISVLRHSLHLAVRWKTETMLSQYRLADWTPLREKESARKAVFLTPEQVARVLRAARARSARGGINERQGEVVIRLALETGARLGEILGLTWEDLDEKGVLRIRTEKHGPDRSITLRRSGFSPACATAPATDRASSCPAPARKHDATASAASGTPSGRKPRSSTSASTTFATRQPPRCSGAERLSGRSSTSSATPQPG